MFEFVLRSFIRNFIDFYSFQAFNFSKVIKNQDFYIKKNFRKL